MFQFPSLASGTYVFSAGSRGFAAGGCPIRKSPGQSLLGGSPELIAACHVLHRLLTPGHPPCALVRLTTTQRMKEFRTAHSESVVKERGRDTSRPIYQNCDRSNCATGSTALLRSSRQPSNLRSELRRASFALRAKDGLPSVARRSFHPSLFERRMVEVNGIEPMASWLQTRRSPN